MLGELIDLVSGIAMGEEADRSRDILRRVYEYFLGGFAGAEGKRRGEFCAPRSVVRLLNCSNPTGAESMIPAAAPEVCVSSSRSSHCGHSKSPALAVGYLKVANRTIPYGVVDRRPGDVAISFADASRARGEFGWTPELDSQWSAKISGGGN